MGYMAAIPQNAIVIQAGHHHFQGGGEANSPCVRSRMVLKCRWGRARVRVNGTFFEMRQGDFLFMPWKHHVTYYPDKEDPMAVGGVHIIPDFRTNGEPISYGAAHNDNHPEAFSLNRNDASIAGLEGIKKGVFREDGRLNHLTEFIIRWYVDGDRSEWQACHLARLLIEELVRHFEKTTMYEHGIPLSILSIMNHVKQNIAVSFSMADLSRMADCSTSTLTRQFNNYVAQTPLQWVLSVKIKHTCHLLETTSLRVGEIGQAIGIDDQYYFSKLFHKQKGMSPTEYRRRMILV